MNKECLEEEMVPTIDWSPRAVQMCEKLIDKSPTVYFDVKATHGGYLFGDLNFQLPDNRLISLEKCLSDLRQSVRGDFNEGEYKIQKYYNGIVLYEVTEKKTNFHRSLRIHRMKFIWLGPVAVGPSARNQCK